MRRPGVRALSLVLALTGLAVVPTASAAPPLPDQLSLPGQVRQVVTVTSSGWSDRRASLAAWERDAAGWHRVHGPVTVRLGWNGWAPARSRRQDTGTTPAGRFTMPYAFGNRADPGAQLPYTRVDSDDMWPYEPRDPATYNIYQPARAPSSRWRRDFRERLASYGYQYAHAVVLGYNLPGGVHWSAEREQYVATRPANTRKGGGIFLHVQRTRYTAGCVAAPLADIEWLVRWVDPSLRPRIVMGPEAWVRRTL